jgi:hypothetical protein
MVIIFTIMTLFTEKAFISKNYLELHIASREMANSGFREKFLDSRIYGSSSGAAFLRQEAVAEPL